MSFDLYFCWHQNEPIDFESVTEWSHRHRHFERNHNQLWYRNEATGVYFSIDFEIKDPEEQIIPSDYLDSGLSFNLNFARPGFFAHEAMPIVVDLCRHFGLAAYDPQSSDGDTVIQDPGVAELTESWLRSNRDAVQGLRNLNAVSPLRMPAIVSEYLWSYSRNKEMLQSTLGDDIFVPGLFPFRRTTANAVGTTVVCTSGIPMIVPASQWIVLRRPKKRFFGRKEEIETGVVSAAVFDSALEGLIEQYPDWKPSVRIIKPESADAVANHLKSIQDMLPLQDFERVGLDTFLDFEDGE